MKLNHRTGDAKTSAARSSAVAGGVVVGAVAGPAIVASLGVTALFGSAAAVAVGAPVGGVIGVQVARSTQKNWEDVLKIPENERDQQISMDVDIAMLAMLDAHGDWTSVFGLCEKAVAKLVGKELVAFRLRMNAVTDWRVIAGKGDTVSIYGDDFTVTSSKRRGLRVIGKLEQGWLRLSCQPGWMKLDDIECALGS